MPGSDNQRSSYRVGADDFEAELFHEGRVVPCHVINLSAGGALIRTGLEMADGTQCTLGLDLEGELASATGIRYVSFHMEVLEQVPVHGGELNVRLRNLTGEGSKAYEQAQKIVFEAQRRARARETGSEKASPMASDQVRRKRFRGLGSARFGKGSTRPGQGDD